MGTNLPCCSCGWTLSVEGFEKGFIKAKESFSFLPFILKEPPPPKTYTMKDVHKKLLTRNA